MKKYVKTAAIIHSIIRSRARDIIRFAAGTVLIAIIKKMRTSEYCEYREDAAIKIKERKRDIKEAIIAMSDRLDELTMILKDDIEN
jgi:hypothetical protein